MPAIPPAGSARCQPPSNPTVKRQPEADDATRFRGGVRSHRRSGANSGSSWDQWIAGELADRPKRPWFKPLVILLGVLVLAAAGVVLFIDLS
jgi:hypothetical protein